MKSLVSNRAFDVTEFGHKVAARRRQFHWSQERLGVLSGVSLRTIKRIEAGEAKRIHPSTTGALVSALKLKVDTPARHEVQHPLLADIEQIPPHLYWVAEGVVRLLVKGPPRNAE